MIAAPFASLRPGAPPMIATRGVATVGTKSSTATAVPKLSPSAAVAMVRMVWIVGVLVRGLRTT